MAGISNVLQMLTGRVFVANVVNLCKIKYFLESEE